MTAEKKAAIATELQALTAAVVAKGWPRLDENHDLCMERAGEWLDGREALRVKHNVLLQAWIKEFGR